MTMFEDAVFSLRISPNFISDGVCFAARRSGLYRSIDYGKTWENAYKSLNTSSLIPTLSVTISPFFDQDQMVFAATEGGIFRSKDAGQSWEFRVLDVHPTLPVAIEISPSFHKDGSLFVATLDDGVYCSTDFGINWIAWNFGLFDLHTNCLAISPRFGKDRTVYAGTESGLYVSSNAGKSWSEVTQAEFNSPITDVAISPYQEGTLIVVEEHSRLLYSTNWGRNWMRLEQVPSGSIERVMFIPDKASLVKTLIFFSDQIWSLENFKPPFCLISQLPHKVVCEEVLQVDDTCIFFGLSNGEILKIPCQ